MAHIEPEEGEEFIPKPREPRKPKPKKIGRPRKRSRRKKLDRSKELSPSQRPGKRWITVVVPADAYVKLKEIAAFRKTSLSKAVTEIIEREFDKVYEESMLLLRIEQRRKREEEELEAQRRNNPARRTRF